MEKKPWAERLLTAVIIAAVLVTVSVVTLLWLRLPINVLSLWNGISANMPVNGYVYWHELLSIKKLNAPYAWTEFPVLQYQPKSYRTNQVQGTIRQSTMH